MLIAALRGDDELRQKVLRRGEVRVLCRRGAAAEISGRRWKKLSIKTVGRALPMVSAWGSTETSPLATDCHFQAKRSGNIGVPIPGTELKLVPSGDKLEVRVRGPNVTPGYWKAPELTAQAFDAEGFYLIGDAVTFADPAASRTRLVLRRPRRRGFQAQFRHLGQRRHVCALRGSPRWRRWRRTSWSPAMAATRCASWCFRTSRPAVPMPACLTAPTREMSSATTRFVRAIAQGLAKLKAQSGNSSGHATRALLLAEPASVDGGEITDKGYINQRAVLTRRAGAVATLDDARLPNGSAVAGLIRLRAFEPASCSDKPGYD